MLNHADRIPWIVNLSILALQGAAGVRLTLPSDVVFWGSAVIVPVGLVLAPSFRRQSVAYLAENAANLLLANVGITLTALMNGAGVPAAMLPEFRPTLGVLLVISLVGFLYGQQLQDHVNDVVFWKRVVLHAREKRFIQKVSTDRPQPVYPTFKVILMLIGGAVIIALTIATFAASPL